MSSVKKQQTQDLSPIQQQPLVALLETLMALRMFRITERLQMTMVMETLIMIQQLC